MKYRIDYASELNPAQLEAVRNILGPVLVIAGAGSGKTRTLVYRVARLVEEGVPPERILLLTFTRKAAREMLRRAALLLDEKCENVSGGTFHSLAHLMLRQYGHLIGYSRNFTILDRGDAEDAINLLRTALGLADRKRRFPRKETIASIFSMAVNKRISLEEVVNEEYPHFLDDLEDLARLFEHYVRYKQEHQLMDYDDLLVNWYRVLKGFPEVRREMGRRFEFIMVDEYQDTNALQAEIVRFMAEEHGNVMVVGDDSQSIYAFRGANFKNIIEFPRLFPGTKIIKLEENYRSRQPILDLANTVIEYAKEKYTKCLFTRREGGATPVLYKARDEADQSRFIADRILELREEGVPLSEIAVLFRSAYHSFDLELELAKRNIPFVKQGGMKLIETAHIKDIVAHLRLLVNPYDMLAWNRVLLLIEGIGPKTSKRLMEYLKVEEDPFEALYRYPSKPSFAKGLNELARLFGELRANLSPEEKLARLYEYYEPIFERVYYDDHPKRAKDLDQLLAIAHKYETVEEFLADLALEPPEASVAEVEALENEDEKLVLSTVHSAKGLEWHSVFVISLAEGRFPSSYALGKEESIEEERRLFYVAVTRAKENLYLTYPATYYAPGEGRIFSKPSRFLEEVKDKLNPWYEKDDSFMEDEEDVGSSFKPGELVWHPVFGEGKVKRMADIDKVVVQFASAGERTLHLKFARLERL
ncbi:ATP-dependent helicase [Thermodesulfatator autotrophicus]|uniref:DNA 3'-5' helicase n=1 Tax=Thermodesulfatator autotrophicus TaxID=1795632 RepID=A0A177E8U0_9BACT|nr:ATP-dependent helicase [Thermodesulfatator autotrophicus]OAG28373.1 ATP-dependent DNA helicase [Thermodesulfatator autotrophicus]